MNHSTLFKFYLFFSLSLTGCTTNLAKLSSVSTIPDFDSKNYLYEDIGTVTGEDKHSIFIIFPTGKSRIDQAITNTLINYEIDYLTDVSIDNTVFYIPYIYGENSITVKGTGWKKYTNKELPIKYNPKTGEQIKN